LGGLQRNREAINDKLTENLFESMHFLLQILEGRRKFKNIYLKALLKTLIRMKPLQSFSQS